MYIELLKLMFTEMVLNKDASKIPQYYHEEFVMYSNQERMDYQEFYTAHQRYYATPIQYKIAYDEETLIEQGKKVAGRVWITTKLPSEPAKEIEVMLIAEYKDNKIYRLWELTFPDWSKLPAFQDSN